MRDTARPTKPTPDRAYVEAGGSQAARCRMLNVRFWPKADTQIMWLLRCTPMSATDPKAPFLLAERNGRGTAIVSPLTTALSA